MPQLEVTRGASMRYSRAALQKECTKAWLQDAKYIVAMRKMEIDENFELGPGKLCLQGPNLRSASQYTLGKPVKFFISSY